MHVRFRLKAPHPNLAGRALRCSAMPFDDQRKSLWDRQAACWLKFLSHPLPLRRGGRQTACIEPWSGREPTDRDKPVCSLPCPPRGFPLGHERSERGSGRGRGRRPIQRPQDHFRHCLRLFEHLVVPCSEMLFPENVSTQRAPPPQPLLRKGGNFCLLVRCYSSPITNRGFCSTGALRRRNHPPPLREAQGLGRGRLYPNQGNGASSLTLASQRSFSASAARASG